MSESQKKKKTVIKESLIFFFSLCFGLFLLPICVYFVGINFFGNYAEGGPGAFLSRFAGQLVNGSPPLWFLALSPYIVIQILRLGVWGIRDSSGVKLEKSAN